jgi:UDP-N-acetylmuramoyl-tripeptide--D-alanyl-D-alanine ligase
MKGMTIENIAKACGGELVGCCDMHGVEINSVVTDSRQVKPGCLFAAIPGEKVDGHDFIDSAYKNGAFCCISERRLEKACGIYILVKSTVAALRDIAEYYRSQLTIPIIGITGSVGKTTAKEMVAAVLSQKYKVLKTAKNENNNLGVPLTILKIQPEHEVAVVEMGISHFGEMADMAAVAKPSYALYTVIGYSHLEFLGDREGVLRAKTELLPYMQEGGKLFVNGDDDLLSALDCGKEKIAFGLGEDCAVRAEDIHTLPEGSMGCTVISGERRFDVEIPAFGAHMIYAALEGAAVGIELGLSDSEIAAGIASYETVGFRALVEKTDDITIFNDCYNSNPNSAASALMSLSALPGRHVAILGDMLELGDKSAELHRDLGELAAESGAELIIACGTLAEDIYRGAREHDKTPGTWFFPNKNELFAALPYLIKKGDAVLVKASRGMRFEEIVEALKQIKP